MMQRGHEIPKKQFLEHDAPSFQSGFTEKQDFGKITHGHLKFQSRRICQGFQRTCQDHAQRSVDAEKPILEHGAHSFQSDFTEKQVFRKITNGHLKFQSRRICQGIQRICHDAQRLGDAEKTVFET
jgi:hypothetical protein